VNAEMKDDAQGRDPSGGCRLWVAARRLRGNPRAARDLMETPSRRRGETAPL
jgi:hypothetical protein